MVGGPCAEGGEGLDRGVLGKLSIVLAVDVQVGEPAQVAPHRLGTVAVPVEEPGRYRTEAGFDVTPQYPAAQGRPFGNVQGSPRCTGTGRPGQSGGFGQRRAGHAKIS